MLKSPYFKIAIFIILGLCIGLLLPKPPMLKGNDLKTLQLENDSLNQAIANRNKSIVKYDSILGNLTVKDTFYVSEINKRDTYISILEHQLDSINALIINEDTVIIKIKKQGYEDINSVNNWDDSQRIIFLSKYFKTTHY